MTHALDLTFDRATDDRVRAEWEILDAAGLPSLARHTGDTNRPHLTLAARDAVTPRAETRLTAVAARLPLDVGVGTLLVLHSGRGWVLARQVVLDGPLLDLHQHAAAVLGPGGSPLTEPGRWAPHLTLASGLSHPDLTRALALLGDAPPYGATAVRLRRWDQAAGRAWEVQASTGRSL